MLTTITEETFATQIQRFQSCSLTEAQAVVLHRTLTAAHPGQEWSIGSLAVLTYAYTEAEFAEDYDAPLFTETGLVNDMPGDDILHPICHGETPEGERWVMFASTNDPDLPPLAAAMVNR